MTRKPRGLKPEEEQLWRRVADTATPLKRAKPVDQILNPPKPKPPKPREAFDVPAFRLGEKADTALPRMENPGARQPLRMDKKVFTRMKRGKATPEARIDLHGMTVAAAETALRAFILRSHNENRRLVLVITGKGRRSTDTGPIPQRAGVLRHHLPEWLSRPPLNSVVLQVSKAHQRHGGSGAFYVYLSRHR